MSEYQWFDLGNGRSVKRRVREQTLARSDLPTPMLIRDFDEPVQSMADGKWYSSKRDLAASHRASGNPAGVDYIELGNETMPTVEHKTDEAKLRQDIRQAKADLDAGWRPDVLTLDE
jgi:hypothetical protein